MMASSNMITELPRDAGTGEIQNTQESMESPPTYSIAKEQEVISRYSNLTGLELKLDGDTIKVKGTDDIIYSLSLSPETGTGDSFSFSLKVFRHQVSNSNSPLIRSKMIYTAKEATVWLKMARVPTEYQFDAESRSFYCFTPAFSMRDEDAGLLRPIRFGDFMPWPGPKDRGEWRIAINPEPKNHKSLRRIYIIRNRKGHGAPAEFEYRIEGSKKVLAVDWEAIAPHDKPVLQWKGELDDRRFLHAVTLAWVTAIWHKARKEILKEKAKVLEQTLTWRQRLEMRVQGKRVGDGLKWYTL